MSSNEKRKEFYRRVRAQQEMPEKEAIQAKIATHKYKTRNAKETGLGNKTKGEER